MSTSTPPGGKLPPAGEPKSPQASAAAVAIIDGEETILVSRAAKSLDVWHIPPRVTRMDPVAKAALDKLAAGDEVRRLATRTQREIERSGLGNALAKVTARLRRMGHDDIVSSLVSNRTLYSAAVGAVLENTLSPSSDVSARDLSRSDTRQARAILEDDAGFASSVLRELERRDNRSGFKHAFLVNLVKGAANARRLFVSDDQIDAVADLLAESGLSLSPGAPISAIERAIRKVAEESTPISRINDYIQRKELKPERFTESVRNAMVRRLIDLGVNFDKPKKSFDDGQLDEYFALAYAQAVQDAPDSDGVAAEDFQVRIFDDQQSFGVDREAILGVGMLDYVYEVGEGARAFDLVERLVLDHEAGLLGTLTPSSDPALNGEVNLGVLLDFEFDQMQSGQLLGPEERAMYYRRAMGKGDAEALADAPINDGFADAWDALILAAYQYIEKEERVGVEDIATTPISRTPIYEAARELQRNLTQFGSGIGRRAKSLYARLDRAFKILEHPDTADYAGGGRPRTLVKTIERLAHDRLETTVNASSALILAVDGNRIFRFIADFDPGTVTDESFRELLSACERYAIARGSRTADVEAADEEFDESTEDEFADFDT